MPLSFYCKMWNNILAQFFQQRKDFHFTKEKRIMAGAQLRCSCKAYVNNEKFRLFHASLSLMNCIINNHELFQTNSFIHNINTRNKHHLLRLDANLFCFQRNTFSARIKIFNSLPTSVTILKNDKAKFKAPLRQFLHTHTFYSVEEFLCAKMIYNTAFQSVCSILKCKFIYMCIHDLFHIPLSLLRHK